jgi:hypothetical protein
MTCNGWYIDDTFVPFADCRQGQPNGVATLDETGFALAQEMETPLMYGEDIPTSEQDNTPVIRTLSVQLTHSVLEVNFG